MSLSSSSCFGPMFSWLHGRSLHHSDKQNGLPDRRVSKSIPAKLQWLSSCQWSWPKGTWSHNPWSHSAARSPECEQNIKTEAWYTTIMYRMLMSCGLQILPTYRHPHLYIHKYPPQSKKALLDIVRVSAFLLGKMHQFPNRIISQKAQNPPPSPVVPCCTYLALSLSLSFRYRIGFGWRLYG